jgi:putative ABC transport system ATP-binding protein
MIDATARGGAAKGNGGGVDVHCDGVVHIYSMPQGELVALRGVDLDLAPGEAIALLGPSGSGKSTLVALLAGLLRPTAGRLLIGGGDLGRMTASQLLDLRATEIGVVLQTGASNLLPYGTTIENVWYAQRGARRRGREVPWGPRELLERLGLADVAHQRVRKLSAGDQQRVALGIGVANAPRLLLVDEPASQLDSSGRQRVIDLLHAVNHDLGATMLVVTHDPTIAASMPRTVTIRDGRVSSEGRRGEEYAVVGKDGSVHLPPDVLRRLPPGTLLRLQRHASGVDLRAADPES